jgi:hypothetical protein
VDLRHPELPLVIGSREGQAPLAFTVRRIVCGGYTSRDRGEVQRHVRELEALGIPRPDAVPTFFAVASYLAAVAGGGIEVQGPFTSGEVEFVLLFDPRGPWVTVGIGDAVWPLAEVEPHWDELTLRSWVRTGRERRLYQEATLATLLPPAVLIPMVRRYAGRELSGVVFFSGTVPTVEGEVIYGDAYELELGDPRLGRTIRAQYTVHVLEATRR